MGADKGAVETVSMKPAQHALVRRVSLFPEDAQQSNSHWTIRRGLHPNPSLNALVKHKWNQLSKRKDEQLLKLYDSKPKLYVL